MLQMCSGQTAHAEQMGGKYWAPFSAARRKQQLCDLEKKTWIRNVKITHKPDQCV